MMVETVLESSQDFGMSNGVLPQWKRELLQRRAARSRPAPPAPPLPPAPQPLEEDEELRYGPGIVKRLKSRYLSLALRDAPRRRPSVLRRAASLEHLLDERPPPAPRPPRQRPISLAPPSSGVPPRRESVKRARSVDALSRLEAREEPPTPPPPPPPPPRPPTVRVTRPPRRPAPLLRETERPPPDVVKSTLRKFESAPTRRTAPAARVSAVLRGLESGRPSTPEPHDRSPSPPAADISTIDQPECVSTEAKTVSRAALDGIALAGSTVRYAFEAPKRGSHLPLVCASNPVLLGRARLSASPRRVGVIRPMPAPTLERSVSTPAPLPEDVIVEKLPELPRIVTPPPSPAEPEILIKKEPPSALVEPIPRSPEESRERSVTPPPEPTLPREKINGHAEEPIKLKTWKEEKKEKENGDVKSWVRGGSPAAARRRGPPPAANSVVFNFSSRKEVPDYIENDGIILRNKRDKIKASDTGVVVLRPELARDSDSEPDDVDAGPPSPCPCPRFINDNVLINGRSSMPHKPDRHRTARLKIQFDDSLTRTFEYPSETSLVEEAPPASTLATNTRIASAALSRYTPSKTTADAFQLGVTRHEEKIEHPEGTEDDVGAEEGDARPCAADAARSWSEARTHATDLLF